MKKNEKKVGLTPINWLLSIIGILIFASFIALPPIFRVVFKKEIKEEKPVEKVVIENMRCTRSNYVVGAHTENNIIEITYVKDELRDYKKRTEEVFRNTASYEEEKNKQGKYSTAYSLVSGASYDVSVRDSSLKIIIEEEFDLGNFKNDKVKLPDLEEEIEVKSEYKLKDSVTGITSNLSSNGYNCQKVEK